MLGLTITFKPDQTGKPGQTVQVERIGAGIAVRPLLAGDANRQHNQIRAQLSQGVVVQVVFRQHVGGEVIDRNIAHRHQAPNQIRPALGGKIDCHPEFAPVDGVKPRVALARLGPGLATHGAVGSRTVAQQIHPV